LSAARALIAQPDTASFSALEIQALGDAVGRAAQPLHRYRCAACGFEAQHYFWQCPGCLSWDSYPPQRLEDL
jgi:lipopolysaccharide biosynthesis regulator YciM